MTTSLSGVRVWISASIPNDLDQSAKDRIAEFVKQFAQAVFQNEGQVIHGSHPSIIPHLRNVAESMRKVGIAPKLTLALSRFFADPPGEYPDITELKTFAEVVETPTASGSDQVQRRQNSLRVLRDYMASACDVVVCVGGVAFETAGNQAGIPDELRLAMQRGIPTFLLGSLGGAAQGYLVANPQIAAELRNGWDEETNRNLATDGNVTTLAQRIVQQIGRLPLGRRTASAGQRFRILALCGGGMRGVFGAAALAEWERATKLNVVDHFDLVAGTSTGGILAIGLGLGLKPLGMLDFYKEDGPDIFPVLTFTGRFWRNVTSLFKAKFDQSVLKDKLTARFQPTRKTLLSQSQCRLIIPTYSSRSDRPEFFRTPHVPAVSTLSDVAIDAAVGTAAAPTFFSPHTIQTAYADSEIVDGGVWANCPALVGISEAVNVLKIPLDQIDVLSVGTTYSIDRTAPSYLQGTLGWVSKIANFFFTSQCRGTIHYCEQLLGDRFTRVDAPFKSSTLDDISCVNVLANEGAHQAQRFRQIVEDRFLNGVPARSWH